MLSLYIKRGIKYTFCKYLRRRVSRVYYMVQMFFYVGRATCVNTHYHVNFVVFHICVFIYSVLTIETKYVKSLDAHEKVTEKHKV